jgi:hypothetical protein
MHIGLVITSSRVSRSTIIGLSRMVAMPVEALDHQPR